MHELSICEAIAAIAHRHADGRPVVSVQVQIGHLRQVVPEALAVGWTATVHGTTLDGARLDIEHVPAEITCRRCRYHGGLDLPLRRCPACGGDAVTVVAGEECQLTTIELATTDPTQQ